jgi:hypothetical protein
MLQFPLYVPLVILVIKIKTFSTMNIATRKRLQYDYKNTKRTEKYIICKKKYMYNTLLHTFTYICIMINDEVSR